MPAEAWRPLSTSWHPARRVRQGLPARGHLAKGGQRKGRSSANATRAWVVIELNESLSLAWPGTGSKRGEGDGPRGPSGVLVTLTSSEDFPGCSPPRLGATSQGGRLHPSQAAGM